MRDLPYLASDRVLADILLLALLLALMSAALSLGGCASWRSATETVEIERRQGTEQGKPTALTIQRQTQERTQATAGPDAQAIAAMVAEVVKASVPGADAISAAVRAATPDLAPMAARLDKIDAARQQGATTPDLITGILGTATAAASGFAAVKGLEARRLRKAKAEAWAKADEHRARAEAYARDLPPHGQGA